MVDQNPFARDIRSVPSVATAMHIKVMTKRFSKFDIISRLVTESANTRTRNGVAIVIEKIEFYQ